MITRKTRDQIALMRRAGTVVAEMHEDVHRAAAQPGRHHRRRRRRRPRGASTRRGARSNFLGYHGFPAVGLHLAQRGDRPRDPRATTWCSTRATSSRSTAGRSSRAGTPTPRSPSPVGEIDAESQRARRGHRGVAARRRSSRSRTGGRLGDIGAAVEGVAEAAGFTVVREYVGHGIGTAMHEEPAGPELRPGRARARSSRRASCSPSSRW